MSTQTEYKSKDNDRQTVGGAKSIHDQQAIVGARSTDDLQPLGGDRSIHDQQTVDEGRSCVVQTDGGSKCDSFTSELDKDQRLICSGMTMKDESVPDSKDYQSRDQQDVVACTDLSSTSMAVSAREYCLTRRNNSESHSPTVRMDFLKRLNSEGLSEPLPGDNDQKARGRLRMNPIKRLFARKKGMYDPLSTLSGSRSVLPDCDQDFSLPVNKKDNTSFSKRSWKIGAIKEREDPVLIEAKSDTIQRESTLIHDEITETVKPDKCDVGLNMDRVKEPEREKDSSKKKLQKGKKLKKETILILSPKNVLPQSFPARTKQSLQEKANEDEEIKQSVIWGENLVDGKLNSIIVQDKLCEVEVTDEHVYANLTILPRLPETAPAHSGDAGQENHALEDIDEVTRRREEEDIYSNYENLKKPEVSLAVSVTCGETVAPLCEHGDCSLPGDRMAFRDGHTDTITCSCLDTLGNMGHDRSYTQTPTSKTRAHSCRNSLSLHDRSYTQTPTSKTRAHSCRNSLSLHSLSPDNGAQGSADPRDLLHHLTLPSSSDDLCQLSQNEEPKSELEIPGIQCQSDRLKKLKSPSAESRHVSDLQEVLGDMVALNQIIDTIDAQILDHIIEKTECEDAVDLTMDKAAYDDVVADTTDKTDWEFSVDHILDKTESEGTADEINEMTDCENGVDQINERADCEDAVDQIMDKAECNGIVDNMIDKTECEEVVDHNLDKAECEEVVDHNLDKTECEEIVDHNLDKAECVEVVDHNLDKTECEDIAGDNIDETLTLDDIVDKTYDTSVDQINDTDNVYDEISEEAEWKDGLCLASRRFQFLWKRKDKKLNKGKEVKERIEDGTKSKVKLNSVKPVIKPKPVQKMLSRSDTANEMGESGKRQQERLRRTSLHARDHVTYHEIDDNHYLREHVLQLSIMSSSGEESGGEFVKLIKSEGPGRENGQVRSESQDISCSKAKVTSADSHGYEIPAKFTMKSAGQIESTHFATKVQEKNSFDSNLISKYFTGHKLLQREVNGHLQFQGDHIPVHISGRLTDETVHITQTLTGEDVSEIGNTTHNGQDVGGRGKQIQDNGVYERTDDQDNGMYKTIDALEADRRTSEFARVKLPSDLDGCRGNVKAHLKHTVWRSLTRNNSLDSGTERRIEVQAIPSTKSLPALFLSDMSKSVSEQAGSTAVSLLSTNVYHIPHTHHDVTGEEEILPSPGEVSTRMSRVCSYKDVPPGVTSNYKNGGESISVLEEVSTRMSRVCSYKDVPPGVTSNYKNGGESVNALEPRLRSDKLDTVQLHGILGTSIPLENKDADRTVYDQLPVRTSRISQTKCLPRLGMRASLSAMPAELTIGHGQNQHVASGQNQLAASGQNQHVASGQNQHVASGQNQHVASGQNQHVASGQNQHIASGQNQHAASGQNQHVASGQNQHVASGQNQHVASGQNQHIASGQNQHVASNKNEYSAPWEDRRLSSLAPSLQQHHNKVGAPSLQQQHNKVGAPSLQQQQDKAGATILHRASSQSLEDFQAGQEFCLLSEVKMSNTGQSSLSLDVTFSPGHDHPYMTERMSGRKKRKPSTGTDHRESTGKKKTIFELIRSFFHRKKRSLSLHGAGHDMYGEIHQGAGHDMYGEIHQGAGHDMCGEIHQGAGHDMCGEIHQGAGHDMCGEIHQGAGHNIDDVIHQGVGHTIDDVIHQGAGHTIDDVIHQGVGHTIDDVIHQGAGHNIDDVIHQGTGHTVDDVIHQGVGHTIDDVIHQGVGHTIDDVIHQGAGHTVDDVIHQGAGHGITNGEIASHSETPGARGGSEMEGDAWADKTGSKCSETATYEKHLISKNLLSEDRISSSRNIPVTTEREIYSSSKNVGKIVETEEDSISKNVGKIVETEEDSSSKNVAVIVETEEDSSSKNVAVIVETEEDSISKNVAVIVETEEDSISKNVAVIVETEEDSISKNVAVIVETEEDSSSKNVAVIVETEEDSSSKNVAKIVETEEDSISKNVGKIVATEEDSSSKNVAKIVETEEDSSSKNVGKIVETEEDSSSKNVAKIVETEEDSSSKNVAKIVETEEDSSSKNVAKIVETEEDSSSKNVAKIVETEEDSSSKNVGKIVATEEDSSSKNVAKIVETEEDSSSKNVTKIVETEEDSISKNVAKIVETEEDSSSKNVGKIVETEEDSSSKNVAVIVETEEDSSSKNVAVIVETEEDSISKNVAKIVETEEDSISKNVAKIVETEEDSSSKNVAVIVETEEDSSSKNVAKIVETEEDSSSKNVAKIVETEEDSISKNVAVSIHREKDSSCQNGDVTVETDEALTSVHPEDSGQVERAAIDIRPVCRLFKINEDQTRTLILIRPPLNPLGIFFTKRRQQSIREGVFVSSFLDKSYADLLSGFLEVGDQLLDIDGSNVSHVSLSQLKDFIQSRQEMIIRVLPVGVERSH